MKNELGYYVHTHKFERYSNSHLFRLNKISHDEKLENLTILLSDDDNTSDSTICDLPSNDEVLLAMKSIGPICSTIETRPSLEINELCVSAWQNSVNEYTWYIGYVKKIESDGFVIDYMHRVADKSNLKWKYPEIEDVEMTEDSQIVPCKVEGVWDITADARIRLFTLTNVKHVRNAFLKQIK